MELPSRAQLGKVVSLLYSKNPDLSATKDRLDALAIETGVDLRPRWTSSKQRTTMLAATLEQVLMDLAELRQRIEQLERSPRVVYAPMPVAVAARRGARAVRRG